jgi:hypothetical protein
MLPNEYHPGPRCSCGECLNNWRESMGDNGFSDFKKPDPSPFRLFCEDTFKKVFGNEHKHEWLRPDNGVIECATCGATRNHYSE